MVNLADSVSESLDAARGSRLNTAVAVLVSLCATFIALCNVKDGNIVQAMAQAQANSVDAWSYYQAKSTKQHYAEGMVDQLSIQRDTIAGITPEARALLDRKIADYTPRPSSTRPKSENQRRRPRTSRKQYDRLNFHDDQFDMAEAGLVARASPFSA